MPRERILRCCWCGDWAVFIEVMQRNPGHGPHALVTTLEMKVSEQKTEKPVCGVWVTGVGPCVAYKPCEVHEKLTEKRIESEPICKHENTVVTEVDWCNDCGKAI